MQLRFLSKAANVGLARVAVASFAAQLPFSLADLEEIKVAVSEAVSNAMIHGYSGREDGWVEVRARIAGRELQLAVQDWGVGIADIHLARQPNYSSDPERMGLGFAFMESFMHGLEVESRVGAGTTVRMRREAILAGELESHVQ
ncbi:MAG: anti-sigma F factor [Firmicutes bacterium]|nr:anti-sigma F factor [Bacillota bacterium]